MTAAQQNQITVQLSATQDQLHMEMDQQVADFIAEMGHENFNAAFSAITESLASGGTILNIFFAQCAEQAMGDSYMRIQKRKEQE